MMKKKVSEKLLQKQALLVMNDISHMMSEFTNDTPQPKFYLQDQVSDELLSIAASFTALSYRPELDVTEVADHAAFGMLYLSATYGFRVYTKELLLQSKQNAYVYKEDLDHLSDVRITLLALADKKELTSTDLADTIFDLYQKNLEKNLILSEFEIPDYTFSKELFLSYVRVSLFWGYNFAKQILTTT